VLQRLPPIISDDGDDTARRFIEFFTANIRNKNTRLAYAQAEKRRFTLELIEPVVVAAYIEKLGTAFAKPTVKQHLAAIRMLFDWLVEAKSFR
jgi:integrase/recombinase XerD